MLQFGCSCYDGPSETELAILVHRVVLLVNLCGMLAHGDPLGRNSLVFWAFAFRATARPSAFGPRGPGVKNVIDTEQCFRGCRVCVCFPICHHLCSPFCCFVCVCGCWPSGMLYAASVLAVLAPGKNLVAHALAMLFPRISCCPTFHCDAGPWDVQVVLGSALNWGQCFRIS